MGDEFVPQLKITVDGTELHEQVYDVLAEVRAESSVQMPDQVRLRFIDECFELFDRDLFRIGQPLTVALSSQGAPVQVADCDITALGVEPGSDGGMTMVVTALGADHLLYRGVGRQTFVDQTDSEIVASIASSVGLTGDVDSSSFKHEFVMQACTAKQFLDERANLIGYRWWVDGRTLRFKKDGPDEPGPTLTWGEDLLSLRVMTSSAGATEEVVVRSWNPSTQEDVVGSSSLRASLATIGTDASGPTGVARDSGALAVESRFQANASVLDVPAADALANSLAARAAADALSVRGSAIGDPALRAGRTVTLDQVGAKLSGKYRLARVEHVYDAAAGYITRFSTGGQESAGLVDLLSRPERRDRWQPQGLVTGVVTQTTDPDRPARVKVRFPTFSDEFESAWARVASPGAGPGRGLLLHPELDDEVLVGFEGGDPSQPVVLGGLWSQRNEPPLANDEVMKSDAVTVRSWVSRAGHAITINDDSDDPDCVVVALADKATKVTIAQDRVTIETPSDLTITTDADAKFVAKGDLVFEGANVSITAKSKLDLTGSELTAKGNSSATLQAGGSVTVKGSSGAAIDGGAQTTIKGGMVQIN